MVGLIFRRLLGGVFVLWVVLTLAFFMVRLIPGDPLATEKAATEEARRALRQRYGLDLPLSGQYMKFLQGAARFDFGPSMKYRNWQVTDYLLIGFPVSAFLGFLALTFAAFLGVMFGALAAARRNGWVDHLTMASVVLGVCLPNFVVAPVLAILFGLWLAILPPAGWGTPAHLVLPALVLALPYLAYIARLTRAGMVEEMARDYVRTARAKGLAERHVIAEHALRNAIIPVVTFLGPAAAGIITGSFVVEILFHVPGMGPYFVNAFINNDYPLILGDIALYSSLLIVFNILVDVSYAFIDPRVKVS